MKQDWFEKGLADRLTGLDSDMDFEAAWSKIEAKRKKKKEKNCFILAIRYCRLINL